MNSCDVARLRRQHHVPARLPGRLRWVTAFALALICMLTFGTGGRVLADNPTCPPPGAPCPGAVDPLGKPGRYTLFREDELYFAEFRTPYTDNFAVTFLPDKDLHFPLDHFGSNRSYLGIGLEPQISAAAGRLTTEEHDQVVYAQRAPDSNKLNVFLAGRNDNEADTLSYTLPNLTPTLHNILGEPFVTPMSLAVGDLDKMADADGNNHDEVVVVYASPAVTKTLSIKVTVADYADPGTDATKQPVAVTKQQTAHLFNQAGFQPLAPVDNILGTSIGDFDGDGMNEIAVLQMADINNSWLVIYRYSNDGKGNRALTAVSEKRVAYPANTNLFEPTNVSMAAGDLDGDGTDELIATFGEMDGDRYLVHVFKSDSKLAITDHTLLGPGISELVSKIQLVTGLFKFDPGNGYTFGRREFAFGWSDAQGLLNVHLAAIVVDAQQNMSIQLISNNIALGDPNYPASDNWSLTAGNFIGNGDPSSPLWQVGFSYQSYYPNSNTPSYAVGAIAVTPNGQLQAHPAGFYGSVGDGPVRLPVVAYDYDGDAVYLGAPVHMTISNLLQTDWILQEPPKHAYYDNRETLSGGQPNPDYGKIVNISRVDGFNVQMKDSQQESFSSKTIDRTDNAIGTTTAATAAGTITLGFDNALGTSQEIIKGEMKAQGSYDYAQHKEGYESEFHSRTVTQTGQTDKDDFVHGQHQTVDIWRYRIYGTSQQAGENPFYDFVLPGPGTSFSLAGLALDGYQPVYENGNILSYPPRPDGGNYLPADLGSFKTISGTTVITAPLVPAFDLAFDGTSSGVALDFTDQSGGGTTRTYSKTLTESLDLKLSFETKVKWLGAGIEQSYSLATNLRNNNSWGETKTTDSATGESKGITLNKPSADIGNKAYNFQSLFYITQDGTIKAAHTVDVLGNPAGKNFWKDFYGGKPDAALNLPQRLSYNSSPPIGWYPNIQSSRKRLRGFYLTQQAQNAVTHEYDYLSGAVTAGEPVRVVAQVYNYSTGKAIDNLRVRFQAVEYDDDNDKEIGNRVTIGETTVLHLDPLQNGQAVVVWDTAGFGGGSPNAVKQYRIYVVLDPDNAIDEIYETENPDTCYPWSGGGNTNDCQAVKHLVGIAPGQNNEGWGMATVITPKAPAEAEAAQTPPDAFLKEDAIAVWNGKQVVTENAKAPLNQPLRVRIGVHSDKNHAGFGYLFVYDGDPAQGGTLIAIKHVHAGNREGSYVWFEWTPTTPGTHQLVAQLFAHADDPNPDNHTDKLNVTVVQAAAHYADLGITITAPPAPKRGQEIPFTITVENKGKAKATNVIVADKLRKGLTFLAVQVNGAPSDACAFDETTRRLRCTFKNLPAGKTLEVVLRVRANKQLQKVRNAASVRSNLYDPDRSNNKASVLIALTK